jgi:hypothetical protein
MQIMAEIKKKPFWCFLSQVLDADGAVKKWLESFKFFLP